MKCPYCGKIISDDAHFCDGCGSPVVPHPSEQQVRPNDPFKAKQVEFLQLFTNSDLILKIYWSISLLITLGLTFILVSLLRLRVATGGQFDSLDKVGTLLTGLYTVVSAMQVITNFSVVLIIADVILLALCMYVNRERIIEKISTLLYVLGGVQLVYLFSGVSKINGMAQVMHRLKAGDIGSLITGYATGDFNAFSYLKTGNIVFVVICFILMAVCLVLSGLLLFADKNVTARGIIQASKTRAFKIILSSVGCAAAIGILVGVGLHIYSTYIYKNNVNVLDGVSITYNTDSFSGESAAQVVVSRPDTTQKHNKEIQNFLNSVTYRLNKTNGISNGDTLTVQATIDPSVEKKDRIKVVGDIYKSIKVKGLKEYVSSIKQLSTSDIQALTDLAQNSLNQKYSDSMYQGTTVTFDNLYYRTDTNEDGLADLTLDFSFKVHQVVSYFVGYPDTSDFEEGVVTDDLVLDENGKLDLSKCQFNIGGVNTDAGFTRYSQQG